MAKLFAIGGATVDLIGIPFNPLKYHDSNPGNVKLSFGGVARNIAENASKCGTDVSLMTLFGDDAFGQLCYQYCQKIGIDLMYSKTLENHNTATYLALLQDSGEMNLAIADMEILQNFNVDTFDIGINTMKVDDYCAIDTNLSIEVLESLCAKITARIAMDPISTQKAIKAKSILKYLSVFKPNLMEAELVCGFEINDEISIRKALDYFTVNGVKEILITCGEKGVYVSNGISKYHIYHESVNIVNTTGGGDAFLGVYLSYRLKGYDWLEACEWGLAAAFMTVQSNETVVPNLNEVILAEVKSKIKITREGL